MAQAAAGRVRAAAQGTGATELLIDSHFDAGEATGRPRGDHAMTSAPTATKGLITRKPLQPVWVGGPGRSVTVFEDEDPVWYQGNQLPPLVIPNGKQCFYMSNVQSTATQQVKMVDASGATKFQLQGASSSGSTMTPIGSGFFVANNPADTYSLSIGAYQGSNLVWSRVVLGYINLYLGATVYCYNYVYVADDWTANDNANCSVSIYWLMYAG
jgi:hypothetical protein